MTLARRRRLDAARMLLLAAALAAPLPAAPPRTTAEAVLGDMDRTADPCQDFYRYACGGWLDRTTIPGDQTRWARSFSVVAERNREDLRELVEAAAREPGGHGERRKVGDFYAACMDEAKIEAQGLAPLRPWLERLDAASSRAELFALTGELQRFVPDPLLSLVTYPDPGDPGTVIVHVGQGGLGLPDRDDYLSEEPRERELRAAYETHVARLLALAGTPAARAAEEARAVVAFETALARASRSQLELRDPDANYNKMAFAAFAASTPGLDWDAFFARLGAPVPPSLDVQTPEFFVGLAREMAAVEPEVLRAYLQRQLLDWSAPLLSTAFTEEGFDFYARRLAGQREMAPRWKRCLNATGAALPYAVGRLYVEARFSPESKRAALEMIHDVGAAFAEALPQLAWMDPATRDRARGKYERIRERIGYPDRWRDISGLAIGRESHFENARAAAAFETARLLAKVGKPDDPTEWTMPPQLVNAGYSPLRNTITFPAAILQPPFFDPAAPPALSYGAIGTVMGHEITHGFDDEGRKFDADGRLREWWEPAVAARFEERAACLRDQYSRLQIEPGLNVDGALTLGENIADNGGLRQSWRAYQRWEARHGPGAGLGPLTDEQLFFVGHAQVWCELSTPESSRLRQRIDVHAPGFARALGPIRNHPGFARAFACEPATPMNPADKCEVW